MPWLRRTILPAMLAHQNILRVLRITCTGKNSPSKIVQRKARRRVSPAKGPAALTQTTNVIIDNLSNTIMHAIVFVLLCFVKDCESLWDLCLVGVFCDWLIRSICTFGVWGIGEFFKLLSFSVQNSYSCLMRPEPLRAFGTVIGINENKKQHWEF